MHEKPFPWHTFTRLCLYVTCTFLTSGVKFTFVNSNVYSLGGCPFGRDEVWNITWPATNASGIARQKCPGGSEAEGKTVKYLLFFYNLLYSV